VALNDWFTKFACKVSASAGSPWATSIALLIIVVWACTGSLFDYSDTWQLYINTPTTIITFLMVFIIQNTQNRDSRAFHLKLDELIRSSKARNEFIDVEDKPEKQVKKLKQKIKKVIS
jgi:low affinity Fe/Cu permease